jgi:hypothetical protein
MGKNSGSGSGMNIPDYFIFESLETIFLVKIHKCKSCDGDADPDPGIFLTLDKHPGSATLV